MKKIILVSLLTLAFVPARCEGVQKQEPKKGEVAKMARAVGKARRLMGVEVEAGKGGVLEIIGAGVGAVVGFMVGGVFGAIGGGQVGAAIGAKVGGEGEGKESSEED